MPSSASRTTASGSLMSFFMYGLHSVGGGSPPRTVLPRKAAGQSARGGGAAVHRVPSGVDVRREAHRRLARHGRLVGLEHAVDQQHVVHRRGLRLGRQPLAVPERADLVHRLLAQRLVRRGDRLAEADLDLVAPGEEPARPAPGPVLAGRHRGVRAVDVDRHDVEVVAGGDHRRPGADLADLAVAGARALREHEQVPALADQLLDVVERLQPAAVAAERHRVEHQRDAVGLPAPLVEVVGGRGHRGAVAPLARDRAQDRRRVEMARVVRDEDDRAVHPLVEDLAADRATAQVEVRHRPEDAAEEHLAGDPRVAAAGPGDVHLRVLPREVLAAGAQLGAPRAQLAAELGHALLELGHPLPQLRYACLDLGRPRLALLERAVELAFPHGTLYSAPAQRFRHRSRSFLRDMKWWGWGDESTAFTDADKPELRPFIRRHLATDIAEATGAPVTFAALPIPPARLNANLSEPLAAAVGEAHVSTDAMDRVVHARGKSLRDLVRHRTGELGRLPDCVVRPGDEAEVAAVLAAALAADAVVIPFGGGSNISGSLEAPAAETRPGISVDMGRMDRVLSIDAEARLAEVQAGGPGPELERQLNARGWTLGHFPDSFAHSTLGGWIATRSSGMQSDKYGDIADLTRGLRVVTPTGMLVVRPVPSTSTGPSVREMVLGSEGRLGLISTATVHVHRLPAQRVILGYLFPTWAASLAAMRDLAESEATPSVTRVSDPEETQFSFATRKRSGALERLQSKALMTFLRRRRGFDLERMCLAFVGYEGSERHVKAQRRAVGRIVTPHRGLCIGSGAGGLYDQKKVG